MIWFLIGIGWLFVLGLVLYDAEHYEVQNELRVEHNHGEAPSTILPPKGEYALEEKHRAAERDYWAHERCHNKFVTILSAIAAVAAACGAIFAWEAYHTAQAQERPWVSAPKTQVIEQTKGPIVFEFDFKNVGHTATKGLYIDAKIDTGDSDQLLSKVRDMCKIDPDKFSKEFGRFSLIPGETHPVDSMETPSGQNTREKPYTRESIYRLANPHLVGCARYGSPFDNEIHQTGFLGRLGWQEGRPAVTRMYTIEPN